MTIYKLLIVFLMVVAGLASAAPLVEVSELAAEINYPVDLIEVRDLSDRRPSTVSKEYLKNPKLYDGVLSAYYYYSKGNTLIPMRIVLARAGTRFTDDMLRHFDAQSADPKGTRFKRVEIGDSVIVYLGFGLLGPGGSDVIAYVVPRDGEVEVEVTFMLQEELDSVVETSDYYAKIGGEDGIDHVLLKVAGLVAHKLALNERANEGVAARERGGDSVGTRLRDEGAGLGGAPDKGGDNVVVGGVRRLCVLIIGVTLIIGMILVAAYFLLKRRGG